LPEWFDENTKIGYLIYYGHDYYRNPSGDSLVNVTGNLKYEIYRTSHGILVKKKYFIQMGICGK